MGPRPRAVDDHPYPEVVRTEGRLPRFWDRSTVFFGNLLALFFGNEAETGLLASEVGQIDSYGGRLIPILDLLYRGGDNLLVLECEPNRALCDYFRDDLGLALPDVAVLSHADYEALGRTLAGGDTTLAGARLGPMAADAVRAGWVDGYVTDAALDAIAGYLGCRTVSSPSGSRCGNNKLLLHRHLEASGLPVFDTEIAEDAGDVERCLRALRARGFRRAVVKSQIGASGIGILRLPADASADWIRGHVSDLMFFEGPCLVQGWEEPAPGDATGEVHSPSVQLFLDDESVVLYDLTEQILSGESVHQGNAAPPPWLDRMPELADELHRQAEIAGSWLHRQGYRGTASVDFLVAPRPGTPVAERVFACEINARITGATYPSVLARHFLPGGAWLMRNLRFTDELAPDAILAMLERKGHLFRPGKPSGVVPINFNKGPGGGVLKGQFLCLGSDSDTCRRFLEFAEHDLPVDWEYARD